MFELIERTGDARALPTRYATHAEATAALRRRAGELRTTYPASTVTEALPRFVAVPRSGHHRGLLAPLRLRSDLGRTAHEGP